MPRIIGLSNVMMSLVMFITLLSLKPVYILASTTTTPGTTDYSQTTSKLQASTTTTTFATTDFTQTSTELKTSMSTTAPSTTEFTQTTTDYITSTTTTPSTTNDFSPTSTYTSACPIECMEGCDVHGNCLDTTTVYYESDCAPCICATGESYYEGFGHGIATGIGIIVAVGVLVGIVVLLTRRMICHHKLHHAQSSAGTKEQPEYVNTSEVAHTKPAPSDGQEYDDVEAHKVDTDKEYTSLGERQPEHHYMGLEDKLDMKDSKK